MNEQAASDGQVKDRFDSVHAARGDLPSDVRLYKDRFGRGPTKARTALVGPDVLICTLEDSLTPAERSLAAMGEHQRLRDTRLFFQHASEDEFCSVVERILGRKVRWFISGIDTGQDISVELFYLEPQQGANGKEQNGSISATQPDPPQV